MTKLLLTCGLLAALTACATSQPAPSEAAASAAPATSTAAAAPAAQSGAAAVAAAPGKPKMVCEDTSRIDSHFQQRVCMTPEQAEARRKAAQASMQNYQLQGSQCSQGGGGGACGGPPR